jgi:fumarate hydratase class II
LKLLISINRTFRENLLTGLEIDEQLAREKVFHSPACTTALSPLIGYHKAAELAEYMKTHKTDIFTANEAIGTLDPDKLRILLKPENLVKKGFTAKDIREMRAQK